MSCGETINFDLKSYEGGGGNSFFLDEDDDGADLVDMELVKNERKRKKNEKKLAKNGGGISTASTLEEGDPVKESLGSVKPTDIDDPVDLKKAAKIMAQERRSEGVRRKQEVEFGGVFVGTPTSGFGEKDKPKQRPLENTSEEQKRLRRIEYYKEGLLGDLNVLYPPPGASFDQAIWNETKVRLRDNGVEWLVMPNKREGGRPVRRFRDGQKMLEAVAAYLNMGAGEPKGWEGIRNLLVESNIDEGDLLETRERLCVEKGLIETRTDGVDDPMQKLAELATNHNRVLVWMKMLAELPTDLARHNARMMMEAALQCIADPKKRKLSQGEWKSTYLPLLGDLGISFEGD